MPGSQSPTVHEKITLHEMIRMETVEVQKIRAMMPMIADPEMRQLFENCSTTGQAHLRALVDFCKATQLAH